MMIVICAQAKPRPNYLRHRVVHEKDVVIVRMILSDGKSIVECSGYIRRG